MFLLRIFIFNILRILECNFTITKALGKPTPMFLVPGTTNVIHGADRFGSVHMERTQNIELHCPGRGNYLKL